jgi:serine/threonine-protein kinase
VSARATAPHKICSHCGAAFPSDAAFCPKDGTRLAIDTAPAQETDPYIGTVISGDIEILSVAGVGAMGRVYRAHQRGVDRSVAVKILHRELSGHAQLVQRFHREAKIASRLQHPHVVEVYFTGQLPDGALFIVMEYLDGLSLGATLAAEGGALPAARAISIALQVCEAVGEGHTRGIVHRDLKPENIMLVRRADTGDWAKVLDFGIAKLASSDQSIQTAAGLVFGTARYISPEGAQGANVGPPGDVYSLATIVYQMLAGRTPFDAEPVGLLIKHIHEAPPLVTSWAPAANLPPALASVVMANLAKDPGLRAHDGRAFANALARAAAESGIAISSIGVTARAPSNNAARGASLDPTLDDVSQMRGPAISTAPSDVPRASTTGAADDATTAKRGSRALKLLGAFTLGAALMAAGSQQWALRGDKQHDAHISKTRAALADSRYVTPPGDCVRDLVVAGLARWPGDVDLLQLRSTASMELVTRAMVAQNGGDVAGARDLARDATLLDPTDHSAALLLQDYENDAKAVAGDGGAIGKARVLFEALPITHSGQRVELAVRLVTPSGARAKIETARMTLFDHSATVDGVKIPLSETPTHRFGATIAAPKVGNYNVVFEVTVDSAHLRAERELTVLP